MSSSAILASMSLTSEMCTRRDFFCAPAEKESTSTDCSTIWSPTDKPRYRRDGNRISGSPRSTAPSPSARDPHEVQLGVETERGQRLLSPNPGANPLQLGRH